MRIAIVGCGYVADFYMNTLVNYPQLDVAAVTDRNPVRLRQFAGHYGVPAVTSLDPVLGDPSIEMVVNLTNPESHFAVSKACIESGKHVYSEKPLALDLEEAQHLVELAEQRERYLASGPCTLLGESAQTLWKALREQRIGVVRLAYAELDEGSMHRLNYRKWRSESGAPWPYENEFETGCTLEHAGYYVTWLTAFFGPATSVTSFASLLMPGRDTGVLTGREAPDFAVACIEFSSGVVARLTCGIIAPRDDSLRVIGDGGVLFVKSGSDPGSPVYIQKRSELIERVDRRFPHIAKLLSVRRYPLVRKPAFQHSRGKLTNFARGIAELAAAISEGRPCRLSARYALHVNEVVLAIQNPRDLGSPRAITSTFDPIEPMPWANR